jgi:hypothetical protein
MLVFRQVTSKARVDINVNEALTLFAMAISQKTSHPIPASTPVTTRNARPSLPLGPISGSWDRSRIEQIASQWIEDINQ